MIKNKELDSWWLKLRNHILDGSQHSNGANDIIIDVNNVHLTLLIEVEIRYNKACALIDELLRRIKSSNAFRSDFITFDPHIID